jgi:predicted RNase H-like HicB family nuclease
MEIKIIIEKTSDFYSAYADNIEGIYGGGDSVESVKKNILDAIELRKNQVPGQFEKGYTLSYKFDVQSFLNYYSKVFSMVALERLTGINQKQLHHYAMGIRKPREAQKNKIETALHDLGKELLSVNL